MGEFLWRKLRFRNKEMPANTLDLYEWLVLDTRDVRMRFNVKLKIKRCFESLLMTLRVKAEEVLPPVSFP